MATWPVQEETRYRFSDGQAEVVLDAAGERNGVVRLVPGGGSADDLVHPRLFLLNCYRLLAQGRLLAIARQQPVRGAWQDGQVVLRWQPTDVHPVAMTVAYRVTLPDTIDVTVDVEAQAPLAGYEVFFSSYFAFDFDPYLLFPRWAGRPEDPALVRLEAHPYIYGNYVVAPRDDEAARQRLDGRWRQPDGRPVARWSVLQYYARPVGVMAREGLYVVQMAEPEQCLSVNASYVDRQNPNDPIAKHSALYFGLFGQDVAPGQRLRTRLRQVVVREPLRLERVLELYDAFAAGK